MLEPSRRHGHYDGRWSAWPAAATSRSGPSDEAGLESIDPVADGLSWETFGDTFYPGKRHYFPAVHAWSLYRDGDRSRPVGASPLDVAQ